MHYPDHRRPGVVDLAGLQDGFHAEQAAVVGKTVFFLEVFAGQPAHVGPGADRLGRTFVAVVKIARRAAAAALLLAREGGHAVIAGLVGGEGHAGQAVQPRPPEGHQAEERPVHHGDAGIFQPFIHRAEDDLTLFVLDLEGGQSQQGVHIVDPGIGGVEQIGCLGGDLPCRHPPGRTDPLDALRLMVVHYLHIGQLSQLFEEPLFQHLGVVGVLRRQEGPVAEAWVEILGGRHVVAADARRGTEPAELRRVGPGKVSAGGVDLVELGVQAEAVIPAETLEVMGALDGCGVAAGIVVPHMHPGLVDIGGPHEGRRVTLQYQDALARCAAFLRRVEAVEPCAEDDFIQYSYLPTL